MKILIVYDSVFGNTEKVALAMAEAMTDQVAVKRVGESSAVDLQGIDLLVVGSPTRGFRPTEGVNLFLKSLPSAALTGKNAAAFDTRIPPESIESKFFRKLVVMGGYADKKIGNLLKAKGARVLDSAGFFVVDSEGPMVDGEIERAQRWIKGLQTSQ